MMFENVFAWRLQFSTLLHLINARVSLYAVIPAHVVAIYGINDFPSTAANLQASAINEDLQ